MQKLDKSKRMLELKQIFRSLSVRANWFGDKVLAINIDGMEIFFKEVDEDYVEVSFWRVQRLTFLVNGRTGAEIFMNAKRNHAFDKEKLYAFVA
jgi:hypothetical protein